MESPLNLDLLMQLPLTGIVVLVVFYFLKYLQASEERNKEFIKEQREQNNIAIGRLAEEIKMISKEVVITREAQIGFQARMDTAVLQMQSVVTQRNKARPKSEEAD